MSQAGIQNIAGGGGKGSPILSLTGNSGGAVYPTGNNVNTIGSGSITVVGNPSTSTLTAQLTGLTNHSLLVGAGTDTITNLGVATNGQLPIGSSGADPVLATLTAGAGVTITNGAGSITISASTAAMSWSDENSAFNAVAQNGYFIIGSCTGTLPASPTNGDTIQFIVDASATTLTIQANTGQTIRMSTSVSAAAGTAVSTNNGDTARLTYHSTSNSWVADNFVGSWTIT